MSIARSFAAEAAFELDRFAFTSCPIAEAIRVTRPGGKVIFVDYHGPASSNPMRYVMRPILGWLEPFALDLSRQELTEFMPDTLKPEQISSEFYFGGLYQKVIIQL